jgi:hypothetical protein
MKMTFTRLIGATLIILAVAGFVATAIISFTIYSGRDAGTLPSISLVCLLLGLAFYFPKMLTETDGSVSTMRVVVFGIVLLFIAIYMKIGWSSSFTELKISDSWIYILGIAMGSKAIQKFGEENKNEPGDPQKPDQKEIEES